MRKLTLLPAPAVTPSLALDLVNLYVALGWGNGYAVGTVQAAWAASTYRAIVITGDGELVGAARGLSDGALCSWLCEVIVATQWQKRGIGRMLVRDFVDRFGDTAIYADALSKSASISMLASCGIVPRSALIACSRAPENLAK